MALSSLCTLPGSKRSLFLFAATLSNIGSVSLIEGLFDIELLVVGSPINDEATSGLFLSFSSSATRFLTWSAVTTTLSSDVVLSNVRLLFVEFSEIFSFDFLFLILLWTFSAVY